MRPFVMEAQIYSLTWHDDVSDIEIEITLKLDYLKMWRIWKSEASLQSVRLCRSLRQAIAHTFLYRRYGFEWL
ncbi:hypothetical protein ABWH92_03225 [Ahrensia marina]|uniref:hypothetical protein n=1 Tax=Ahrensia marina TaxID=1514904 RepID=UPI0035CEDB7A